MEQDPKAGQVFLAVLAYLPVLFLIPVALRRKDRFLLYHARQGLYLFSVFLVLLIPTLGLAYLFIVVWDVPFLKNLFAVLLLLFVVGYAILVVLMVGSVLQKRMVMLPVLGDFAGER